MIHIKKYKILYFPPNLTITKQFFFCFNLVQSHLCGTPYTAAIGPGGVEMDVVIVLLKLLEIEKNLNQKFS